MGKFGYLIVASALHDAVAVDRVTAGVRAELEGLGLACARYRGALFAT